MKYYALALLMISIGMTGCRKDDVGGSMNNPPSAADKLKDSALDIARDIYLWYSQIPEDFNARSFSDPDKIMTAIRKYSAEPGFTDPVDRWSFAYKKAEWDDVSNGISQDFGLGVFFLTEGDLRVKSVEKASPAGVAGIHRGWRITGINGNNDVTTSNADYIIENVFNSANTTFAFKKPDGTTVNITLNADTYQENPLYLDTIYTAGASKVGYIVFNSFLGDTTQVYNRFQNIFTRFAQQNVNEVIVDLRYNGGGYVSVQERLADYLVNNSGNGNVMMKQQFNDQYGEYNSTTIFNKKGSLNLSRIFFIVSDNTASASELLINNLDPYMDVKLVGPTNTYGKPVGFFPIGVGDWYVFPVSFKSTNKNGVGNYFDGFAPDSQVPDGLDKDWGDKQEACLASVLKYLGTGTFSLANEIPSSVAEGYKIGSVKQGNGKLSAPAFKGAIDTKRF